MLHIDFCNYNSDGSVLIQAHLSKDEARQQLLRILRSLPYGNSVFFSVLKIEDPIGLLPGRIILGINKRGVCRSTLTFTLANATVTVFMTMLHKNAPFGHNLNLHFAPFLLRCWNMLEFEYCSVL